MFVDDWSILASAGTNPREVEQNFGSHFSARGQHWQAAVSHPRVLHWQEMNKKGDRIHHLAQACADGLNLPIDQRCLVNIGSSRGATGFLEETMKSYINHGKVPVYSSPVSTLGAISSTIAHQLKTNGAAVDHSMTCSTSLQAVVNGYAYLKAGLVNQAVVGGVEAPLTDFTFAQFEALRLMSTEKESPCHPLVSKLGNTMVIGEGAGLIKLATEKSSQSKWKILGLGQAVESAKHLVGIKGEALMNSMQRALESSGLKNVDTVLAHAPGTKLGDEVEKEVVKNLLGEVQVLSNKWAFGHTFGASGIMSLIWAGWLLDGWKPEVPAAYEESHKQTKVPQTIMINAIGFGGSAVSIVLGRA